MILDIGVRDLDQLPTPRCMSKYKNHIDILLLIFHI